MDPIDAFPEHLSTTVVPVTLPDKPDALEYAARQGQVRAGIIYQEPTAKRVFVLFCKDHWHKKKTWLDNFKRAVMEAKHVNEFRPNDVMWEKTSKVLLRNPDRLLKNTDKRMVYIYNNIFFAKKDFTFGLRTVKSGEIHLIQTTHVPMLIYELPDSSLKCQAQPNVIRRSFEPHNQMLYHRTIFEPHTAYPIPAGTHYTVLTVQKTAFGLDIIPESILHQLIQKGFHVGDFRKRKKFNQTPYKPPPPTPIHVPAEKRPLEEKSLPKKRLRITPVMRRVSRRSEQPMTPVQIPQPPVQIPLVPQSPVQIPLVPQSPVQIPLVPQSPVQIPDVLEPVQIPVSQVLEPPVQIPNVPEHVQLPVSQVPQSHVQIRPVQIPLVQIPDDPEPVQIPDVPEPVQIPVSQVPQPSMQILPEPVQIPDVPEPVQIPVSQVPQSHVQIPLVHIPDVPEPVQIPLVQIPDVPEPVQIPVSQVPQPPMQIFPEPVQIPDVPEPVQIPVSQVPQPPMQILHVSEPVQIQV
ncbi:uncharacterized protein TNCV_1813401 [Trichonephila clavipes]|uniref:Uncharacterized protein n=1 Tax=Trichonephila clavipes TaxID=2585209 RepID=A0A8X7BFZ9_TRICX|nr:uncharacterized protein TNCV_1813401 [Trichonephila clavipes]